MAESGQPVNDGEENTNTPPSSLGLDSHAQFRTLSRRLDDITEQLKHIERPNKFRPTDGLQIAAILLTFVVAVFTAFGLSNRIDDVFKAQVGAETRLSAQISASESRQGTRLDRIDDRLIKIGERTSTIEGRAGATR